MIFFPSCGPLNLLSLCDGGLTSLLGVSSYLWPWRNLQVTLSYTGVYSLSSPLRLIELVVVVLCRRVYDWNQGHSFIGLPPVERSLQFVLQQIVLFKKFFEVSSMLPIFGKIIFYTAPQPGNQCSIILRNTSSSAQQRRYPLTPSSIALGD